MLQTAGNSSLSCSGGEILFEETLIINLYKTFAKYRQCDKLGVQGVNIIDAKTRPSQIQ